MAGRTQIRSAEVKVTNMKKRINSALNILWACLPPAAIYLLLSLIMPDKIFLRNARYLLIQAVLPSILAWGACFNMTAGHSDFSVGSSMLFSAIVGGNIAVRLNLGVPGLIVVCAVTGMLASGLTGLVFVTLKIPSLITSIGVMLIMESFCALVFNGAGATVPSSYIIFGSSNLTLVYGLAAFAVSYYLFNCRALGTHVRALGNSPAIAEQIGLNITWIRLKCFICVGFFAGLYAALSLGTTGVARPVTPMGTMRTAFDAIMGFMVGTALANKVNTIVAIYIGAVYMQLVNLVLTAVNFPSVFSQSVVAFFVLIVICFSTYREVKNSRQTHLREFRSACRDEQAG